MKKNMICEEVKKGYNQGTYDPQPLATSSPSSFKILKFHPATALFPWMPRPEFHALVEDIKQNGLQEPIVTLDGKILDGRHRYLACLEAGVKPSFTKRDGNDEPLEYVIRANWFRRQLSGCQRAIIGAKLQKIWAKESRSQRARQAAVKRHHGSSGATKVTPKQARCREKAAHLLNVPQHNLRKATALLTGSPALAEQVEQGTINLDVASRRMRRENREATEKKLVAQFNCTTLRSYHKVVHIECADFRKFLPNPKERPHFIITDPPYKADFNDGYADLARLAAEILPDDGALVVMTGLVAIPQIVGAMDRHLPYRWCLRYDWPSGQSSTNHLRKVNQSWKPVWIFSKSGKGKFIQDDVIRAGQIDKHYHPHQQDVEGFMQIIERTTEPGSLICDPFTGTGTTGVATLRVGGGRRFVGCDIDPQQIEHAVRRTKAAWQELINAAAQKNQLGGGSDERRD